MLNTKDIYEEVHRLWSVMTNEEWQFDIYFEQPHKGCGYKGGGEFYLYTNDNAEYILSYSERGEESIIVRSSSFDDIKFELAWAMTESIMACIFRRGKKRFEEGISWRERWDLRLKLLRRADPCIYQKAKTRFTQQLEERKSKDLE